MGNSFTVIQYQRQHFGNQPGSFNDIEPDVPFAGAAKEFRFDCPQVNPAETAILLFQSRDVSHSRNILQVNGTPVYGGLPVSPSRDSWNGNVLLLEPRHQLRATGNVLRLEARNTSGETGGDIDDFIVDNLVVQYKTLDLSQQGIFNVRSFGARGDGSQADFGAILAARDALNAAGGGVLYFPPGTYILFHTLELGANTTVLGAGPGSVLLAKPKDPGGPAFNMLAIGDMENVRLRDLVLDGNRAQLEDPDLNQDDDEEVEDVGCGFLAVLTRQGQTGLSITNVLVRNHHRAGIRIIGPRPAADGSLKPNEVEVIGCRIIGCGSRGILLTRATRARIAGNTIISCTQAGIQLVRSRTVVIDGNVIKDTIKRNNTTAGHGISVAASFDYVIVNNAAIDNGRWGIVASGGVGPSPDVGVAMSRYFVVQNNICRGNAVGGITIDPSTRDTDEIPTGIIHDSFATVASNVCVGNHGRGIQTMHAGYVAVHGNICDSNDHVREDDEDDNDTSDGIGIVSSRYAVVAGNVLTANRHGIAFFGDPDTEPEASRSSEMGHHLLGSNVYDKNRAADPIMIGEPHPRIRQLHDDWPGGDAGGINLPIKTTGDDPAKPVDGVLYLNTNERKLSVYANGGWRNLQTW
jgi:parallel beta-helix repeat protein